MMEQIACKECTSPYCHGCNMYRLEQMLMSGKLDALMDENRTIKMDADVRPVRRGKWENNHCSACGMMPMGEEIWECCDFAPPKFEWFMNFCPNCGADMRGEEE